MSPAHSSASVNAVETGAVSVGSVAPGYPRFRQQPPQRSMRCPSGCPGPRRSRGVHRQAPGAGRGYLAAPDLSGREHAW
jgi:hypothetical protein